MTEEARKEAMNAMNRLMSHPITNPIHSTFSIDLPSFRSSECLGLTAIRERLETNYYRTVYDWITDIESLIYHFEQASGNRFAEMGVAREIRRLFSRERAKMRLFTLASWNGRVLVLKERFARLTCEAPAKIKAHAMVTDPTPHSTFPPSVVNAHQVQCARNACEWLDGEDDVNGLTNVASMTQPDLFRNGGKPLTPGAFSAIGELVKGRLAKRGIRYAEYPPVP
jgi:hypothetical protein